MSLELCMGWLTQIQGVTELPGQSFFTESVSIYLPVEAAIVKFLWKGTQLSILNTMPSGGLVATRATYQSGYKKVVLFPVLSEADMQECKMYKNGTENKLDYWS